MVSSFMLKTAALVSSTLLASTLLTSLGAANGNNDTVTLKHPSGSTAVISLLGVQVLSFRSALDPKTDVLFLSDESSSDGTKRGGVSIAFPNAGLVEGSLLPADGFVRSTKWTLIAVTQTTDEKIPSYAAFRTKATDATLKMYPYKFELIYEVHLSATSLESKFHVINQHSATPEMNFKVLLQNHLNVHSVTDNGVVISGLQGVEYLDIVTRKNMTESRASFGISSRIDNVYENVKNNVTVSVQGEKFNQNVVFDTVTTFGDGDHEPVPTPTDHVVFNPWSEGSKAAGFGDKGYSHMVAIGSGRVSVDQTLLSGLRYIVQQTISVAKE